MSNPGIVEDAEMYRVLMRLREGGSLVCSVECTNYEIITAHLSKNLYTDKDGYQYIYRPRSYPNT